MRWLALVTSLALCLGAHVANAEDSNPAPDRKTVDLTGTWTIMSMPIGGWATGVDSHGQSPESCTFRQIGKQLKGACKTLFGEGPVIGSVNGQKVEWRWLYKRGGVREEGNFDFVVAVFNATLLEDDRLRGGFLTHETYDKFHPSFAYKTTFRYFRPRAFTADKRLQG